jgi:hypothetical protein
MKKKVFMMVTEKQESLALARSNQDSIPALNLKCKQTSLVRILPLPTIALNCILLSDIPSASAITSIISNPTCE